MWTKTIPPNGHAMMTQNKTDNCKTCSFFDCPVYYTRAQPTVLCLKKWPPTPNLLFCEPSLPFQLATIAEKINK